MKLGHISFLVLFTNRDVPCLDGGSLPFSHNAGHITREKCHRHFYSLPQRRVQSAVNLFGVLQIALSFFCRNIALIITTSLSMLNSEHSTTLFSAVMMLSLLSVAANSNVVVRVWLYPQRSHLTYQVQALVHNF